MINLSLSKLSDLDKGENYFYKRHISKEIEEPRSQAMDFGSAFHCYVLEPEKFEANIAIWKNTTRSGNAFKDFERENHDKPIITSREYQQIEQMYNALSKCPLATSLLRETDETEKRINFNLYGYNWSGVIDAAAFDYIVDLKTCASVKTPEQHLIDIYKQGKAPQFYIYDQDAEMDFYYIFITKESPHQVQVIKAPKSLWYLGEDMIKKYVNKLNYFFQSFGIDNEWQQPAIYEPELPTWLMI
jgi:hypothetical protein